MKIGKERPERITVPAPNETPAHPEPSPAPVEPVKEPDRVPG